MSGLDEYIYLWKDFYERMCLSAWNDKRNSLKSSTCYGSFCNDTNKWSIKRVWSVRWEVPPDILTWLHCALPVDSSQSAFCTWRQFNNKLRSSSTNLKDSYILRGRCLFLALWSSALEMFNISFPIFFFRLILLSMLFLLPDMHDTRWVCEGEKEMRKQETVASSAHKRGPVVVVVANRLFLCSVGCWLSRCHSALTSFNVLSIFLSLFFLSFELSGLSASARSASVPQSVWRRTCSEEFHTFSRSCCTKITRMFFFFLTAFLTSMQSIIYITLFV